MLSGTPSIIRNRLLLILMRNAIFCVLFSTSVATAEVVRIDVEIRDDVAGGNSYGLAGPYERLAGKIYYEIDPANSANQNIVDLGYAPLNAQGRVEFSADFYLVKPKDINSGNQTVFLDVMNRGRKRILRYFNRDCSNGRATYHGGFR